MKFDITLAKYRTMTIDARDNEDALRRAEFFKEPGEIVVSAIYVLTPRDFVLDLSKTPCEITASGIISGTKQKPKRRQ